MESDATSLANIIGFFGKESFGLSFVFGGIVIALYAGKRLGELISPPKDEEYDFTKMLSLATMVGKDVFLRSYIFYLFLLEFFYIILCVFQPLTAVLLDQSNTIKFEGSAWPLGAALLVVGVLPATPVVAQIEQSLRQFAHNIAQIPDEFYNRVTALSTQDIEEFVSNVGEYSSEVELFWTVRNILVIIGFDDDEAVRRARKCAALRLFGEWTLDRKELWSQSEYEKYRDVIDLLRPRSEALYSQLTELIRSSETSDFVSGVVNDSDIDIRKKVDAPEQLQKMRARADKILNGIKPAQPAPDAQKDAEGLRLLRDAWSKTTKECDVASKRLIALFAIIARNDKRTLRELERPVDAAMLVGAGSVTRDKRFADPVLRAFAQLLRSNSPTSEPWYNSLVWSSLVVLVVSVIVLGLYRTLTQSAFFLDYAGLGGLRFSLDQVIRTAFLKAGLDAFFLTMAFWFSGVTALFLRSTKLRDGEWMTFYDFRSMPVSSYMAIFLVSSLAAFPALILQYVSYYKVTNSETQSSFLLETMTTNIGVSLSLGLCAVALCIITDMISMGTFRDRKYYYFLLAIGPVVLNSFTLIISPGYLSYPIYLANQMLLFFIVSAGGLYAYGHSLQTRIERPRLSDRPKEIEGDNSNKAGATLQPVPPAGGKPRAASGLKQLIRKTG